MQEKTIKMSLETARKIYKEYKFCQEINSEISLSLSAIYDIVTESFTKEELEGGKKGFTWEESFGKIGYEIGGTAIDLIVPWRRDSIGRHSKSVFFSERQANSALALAQLGYIVAKYNESSSPDPSDRTDLRHDLYEIRWSQVHKAIMPHFCNLGPRDEPFGLLLFHNYEAAKLSCEVNKDLWHQYLWFDKNA